MSAIRALGQSHLAWLVFIAGMVLTGLAWRTVAAWEEEHARHEFVIHAKDTLDAVQQRLEIYANILHGARGLFAASAEVTRDEWRRYTALAALGGHHPGVHTFAFIRYVAPQDKARFEKRVRGDVGVGGTGYPGFAIFPPSPASARNGYFPIEYIEPEANYRNLLGLDRGAAPDTRKTLERARDSGQPAASGRLHNAVENSETSRFFLLVLPIYRNGANLATVMERRAALIGFVTARVELEALLEGVVGVGALEELFFELYDGGSGAEKTPQMTGESLLYAVNGGNTLHAGATTATTRFTHQAGIEVFGRDWRFFFGSRPEFSAVGGYLPIVVLLGGAVTSVLAFVLVLMLVTQRRRVMEEIVRQKSLFSQVMDALPVDVFLKDKDFRFVLVNEEAARTLGTNKEAAVGKTDFDVFPHEIATALREHDEHVRSVGGLVMREERLVSNGQKKCMLAGKKIIRLPGSDEPMLLGFSFDISDRKKAERELEQQQRFIRQVIDNDPNIIFVKDADGIVLLVNQAGAAYWGMTPEQIVGRPQATIFSRCEEAENVSRVDGLVVAECRDIDLEESLTLPGGEVVWLSVVKRPLLQLDGKVHVLCIATDITGRKRAETALRESEERLRAIVDNTTSVVFLKDLEGRYLLTNSEYEKRHGFSREQIVGKTDYDLYPRELAEALRANDQIVLRAGRPMEFEERVPDKSGEHTYIAVKFVLRNAAGEPYAVAGIATDITERLHLEQEAARARANELSRSLADAVGVGLIGVDLSHQVVFANPAAQEVLGFTETEIQGRKLDDVVQAITAEGQMLIDDTCPACEMISAGHTFQTDDWSFRRSDGIRFPVSLALAPMFDNGSPIGSVLSFQDITWRKQAEIALRETERRQAAILDNIPDMAWLKDSESRYITVNEPCAQACGMSAVEVAGKTDYDFWPAEIAELYRRDDHEVMVSRERKRVEEPLVTQDGKTIWIETIKTPLIDGQGRVVGTVGTARDITARHEAEIELNHHMAELARVNAELDEFTYVASHDLQEPVRKLVAFSGLLRKDMGDGLPPRAAQDLDFIIDAAQRMQRLVGDLLALSRTGKVSMVREKVALDDAVMWALDALTLRVRESGATIHRTPLPSVAGDLTLLTQLYQNLIGNALKFAGDQPPEITLTLEQINGEQVFGVRDNGIGIDAQYMEQIFQPFKRLHGRGQYEGSGVGLSICRKVVERHKGRIWVESEEGKGAHFRFTLGDGV